MAIIKVPENLPKNPTLEMPWGAEVPRRHTANVSPLYFMELANQAVAQYLSGHIDKVLMLRTDSVAVEQAIDSAFFRLRATVVFASKKEESWYLAMPFRYCDEPLGRATRKGDMQMSVQIGDNPWKEVLMYEPPENRERREAQQAHETSKIVRFKGDPLD